jgi:valyl-tRNA synthetase
VGTVLLMELEPGAAESVGDMKDSFRQLTGCELAQVLAAATATTAGGAAPQGRFASVEAPGVKALLDLEGLVDVEREKERLLNKARKAQTEAAKSGAKLGNQGFVAKAPEAVVAEERARLSAAEAILRDVQIQYEERIGEPLPALEEKRR